MPKFSANLGTLWTELELLEAIARAARAGFDAVEMNWPYVVQPLDVSFALEATGLKVVYLNTVAGDLSQDEFGTAALIGRDRDTKAALDKAIAYAADINARYVNVLTGLAQGEKARQCLISNLNYACVKAHRYGLGVLIEPINSFERPGYYLTSLKDAVSIIGQVGQGNLKLLLDCYHMASSGFDLAQTIIEHIDMIGHIQIASIPLRQEPNLGETDYKDLLALLECNNYRGHVGAEYHPATNTDAGLGWLTALV